MLFLIYIQCLDRMEDRKTMTFCLYFSIILGHKHHKLQRTPIQLYARACTITLQVSICNIWPKISVRFKKMIRFQLS